MVAIKKKRDTAKVKNIKKLLDAGYERNNVEGYEKDKKLSTRNVSVFNDKNSDKTYVVHRGTSNAADWFTDFQAMLGYEGGRRFKQSQKIQDKAEKVYIGRKIVTIGHSLGGRLAEKSAHKNDEVYTFNKFSTPQAIISSYNHPVDNHHQVDIRTQNDLASLPSTLFEDRKDHFVTLKSSTVNPIAAHSTNQLDARKVT